MLLRLKFICDCESRKHEKSGKLLLINNIVFLGFMVCLQPLFKSSSNLEIFTKPLIFINFYFALLGTTL